MTGMTKVCRPDLARSGVRRGVRRLSYHGDWVARPWKWHVQIEWPKECRPCRGADGSSAYLKTVAEWAGFHADAPLPWAMRGGRAVRVPASHSPRRLLAHLLSRFLGA